MRPFLISMEWSFLCASLRFKRYFLNPSFIDREAGEPSARSYIYCLQGTMLVVYTVNINLEELLGSWIQAIGTIIDAISNTPSYNLGETLQSNLSLIGHVMQATGNALIADSVKECNFESIGNSIQSLGNLTIVSSILINLGKEIKIELTVKGNLLQALGNFLSPFSVAMDDRTSKEDKLLLDLGSILQGIGNSLQALSGMLQLKGGDRGDLNVLGSWIQASGAVLQAVVRSKAA
jgi:hypothetical protein